MTQQPATVLFALKRYASKAAAVDMGNVVVLGQPLVEKRVVRADQVQHTAVFADDALEEQLCLAAELDSLNGVDLLLSDVVLPGGMSGPELVSRARAVRPALRAVYMSGYTEHPALRDSRLDERSVLLNKPFRKVDLMNTIRRALDEEVVPEPQVVAQGS